MSANVRRGVLFVLLVATTMVASATAIGQAGGPDTTITGNPPDPDTSTTATFTFTSVEGATFQCTLDGGAPEACESGKQYAGLAAGQHTFQVEATSNNETGPAATHTWTIEP